MRLIALLVLLAVLPTVELTEQVVHLVEHVVHGEEFDHSAHHDESHRDEHGCTGLVHFCSCHRTQATEGVAVVAWPATVAVASIGVADPASLTDLTSLEPAHRPPIG